MFNQHAQDQLKLLDKNWNRFYDAFKRARSNKINKWSTYFNFYEALLNRYIGKPVTLLEIGVARGGSLDMWSTVLGVQAQIVGIDIDPDCLTQQHPKNVDVHIVDQNDGRALTGLASSYGGFDIVIDDGCHSDMAILSSLSSLWPSVKDHGVYIVEDIHGTFWSEDWTARHSFLDFILNEQIALQAVGSRGRIVAHSKLPFLKRITSDWSIVAFEKDMNVVSPKLCLECENDSISLFNTFA